MHLERYWTFFIRSVHLYFLSFFKSLLLLFHFFLSLIHVFFHSFLSFLFRRLIHFLIAHNRMTTEAFICTRGSMRNIYSLYLHTDIHTNTHSPLAHAHSISLTHAHTHILSLPHTYIHTHTFTHSLTHIHANTDTGTRMCCTHDFVFNYFLAVTGRDDVAYSKAAPHPTPVSQNPPGIRALTVVSLIFLYEASKEVKISSEFEKVGEKIWAFEKDCNSRAFGKKLFISFTPH